MTRTHKECSLISPLLEDSLPQWEATIPMVGIVTAYATKSGLVVFLDFPDGKGWTMLTECPSIRTEENVLELVSMQRGSATAGRLVR